MVTTPKKTADTAADKVYGKLTGKEIPLNIFKGKQTNALVSK
jgi:hypothetical protein